ncbi:hypothetical protein NLG97_g2061 [Lecanicillium saksenae]|uniref:Uncharacterized protein n=1 Tax=Lecanicillium saksenae TaxID=468837 RepID=A0ACC1R1Z0_9HYPO|nr:hypothetical protein NLG97_g2061 [Lecanicillium saksenae]
MSDATMNTRTTVTGGLQQIGVGLKIGTVIVTVGGVGTTPPEHWTNSNGEQWLRTLDASYAPDIAILSFANKLAVGNVLSFEELDNQGRLLRNELNGIVQDAALAKCPIVLVAHSLGGLLIKRALWLATAGEISQGYQNIIPRISSIILMGCPHSISQNLQDWVSVETILQKFTKGKKVVLEQKCMESLAEDCKNFEETLNKSNIQLLTICESKGTSKQVLGKKTMFVDRRLATVGHERETVIEETANHRDLCLMSGSTIALGVTFDVLHMAIDTTRRSIARSSPKAGKPSVFGISTVPDNNSDDENTEYVLVTSQSGDERNQDSSMSVITSPDAMSSTNKASWTRKATTGSEKLNAELIAALRDFTIEQRDPTLPCRYIPFPQDPVFSGREDILMNIRQTLVVSAQDGSGDSSSGSSDIILPLNVYSLCGPGGMGKTSIANEFVHKYGQEFDAIFWVAADQESKLFDSFREISLKLGIVTEGDGKDPTAIRETLLAWLANPLKSYQHMDHTKPEMATWLMVFDNVDRADTLEEFWPKDAAGSVLVTCRDPMVKSSIHLRNSGVVVPELSDREGAALLLRLTGRENDNNDIADAPKVVQALGKYPLAIAQMSGVIMAREMSFSEFLGLYSEESERREIIDTSEGQSASLRRYNQTLSTVWALDDLKEGRALLEVISFLDPDSIPETLLEKNPACADWDRYPHTSGQYTKARAELTSRSLIYRNRDKKTLRVHRLIQDTMRTQMTDETYNEVYSRVVDMLRVRWPRVLHGFGNVQTHWLQNAELWAHCLSAFRYTERFDPQTTALASRVNWMNFVLDILMFCAADSRFAEGPEILSFFTFLRNTAKERNPSVELQLVDASFHFHRGELEMHINNHQRPYVDLGLCVQQLETLLDGEAKRSDSYFGVAINEFGCACMMIWKHEEALHEFERSYTVLKNLQRPTKQETTMAQINMAFVYDNLGHHEKAADMFEKALEERIEELGEDDYSSFVNGKLYLGWGNALAAQGRLDDSFKLHVRCLEHYKRSMGNLHHRTGDGCVKAADHFARIGDSPTALALLDQALKIFYLDTYHNSEAARAHYKKGRIFHRTGQGEDSEAEFEKALRIYNSMVPPEDQADKIEDLDDEDFDHWIMFWSR